MINRMHRENDGFLIKQQKEVTSAVGLICIHKGGLLVGSVRGLGTSTLCDHLLLIFFYFFYICVTTFLSQLCFKVAKHSARSRERIQM